jgi:hypothetical protein
VGPKRTLLVVVGAATLVLGPIAWRGLHGASPGPVTSAREDLSSTAEVVQGGDVTRTLQAPRHAEPPREPAPEPEAAPTALDPAERAAENPTFALVRELETAAERGDTSKLPALLTRRLDADPEAAAPLVRTIGHLAALAPARDRDRAASTLAQWLDEQRREPTTFAKGNVSLLVDALADTGSLAAVDPLVRLLDAGTLAIHQATRAVEALAALGDGRAREAIVRFASRIDGFAIDEELPGDELRSDAREATRRALASLPEHG